MADNTLNKKFDVDAPDHVWGGPLCVIGSRTMASGITYVANRIGLGIAPDPSTFGGRRVRLTIAKATMIRACFTGDIEPILTCGNLQMRYLVQ